MPSVYVYVNVDDLVTKRTVRTALCSHADAKGRKFCPECGLAEDRRESVTSECALVADVETVPALDLATCSVYQWAIVGAVSFAGLIVLGREQLPVDDGIRRRLMLGIPSAEPLSIEQINDAVSAIVLALSPFGVTEKDVRVA